MKDNTICLTRRDYDRMLDCGMPNEYFTANRKWGLFGVTLTWDDKAGFWGFRDGMIKAGILQVH